MGYVEERPWWPIQSPNKGRKKKAKTKRREKATKSLSSITLLGHGGRLLRHIKEMNLLLIFFRIVGSGTEYRINGNSVTPKDYQEKLKDIGILIKAKNFLVFQV